MNDLIQIDGSEGEGGGQVLRTSLALSIITGRPLSLVSIRGRRKKPGLMRQHLTCVRAASQVGAAEVEGDHLGSQDLSFRPQALLAGGYEFEIGGAGSTSLVLQSILPALIRADGPSTVSISGGTHNPLAPCFDFLDRVFFPHLRAMGVGLEARLVRHGFFPAGGGRIEVKVTPTQSLAPFELLRRGAIVDRSLRILTARLGPSVAQRESDAFLAKSGWSPSEVKTIDVEDSAGPGNVLLAEVRDDRGLTEITSTYGEKGLRAEHVGRDAAQQIVRYLNADVPVGAHLADQLLLPMALAGAGAFRCRKPTQHTLTNAALIERFLPVAFRFHEEEAGATTVNLEPRG